MVYYETCWNLQELVCVVHMIQGLVLQGPMHTREPIESMVSPLTLKCSSLPYSFLGISNTNVEFFLFCNKLDFVFLKSNYIYIFEEDYHIFLLWNLKSIGLYLLGQIDIWTWPSSKGQLEDNSNFYVSWPFQSCHKFFLKFHFMIVGNFAIICYVDVKWVTPKKSGVFWENRWRNHPLGWRATWGHFGRFPFLHGASNMCSNFIFFPNPSSQAVHNHHLVLRKKKILHAS